MGLYETIQTNVGKAFDTSLYDATRIVQFVTITDNYDPNTMISTQTEVDVDVRVVITRDETSEEVDSSGSFADYDVLVLDSDRNGVVFFKDMQIKDGNDYFKISSFDTDPAKASWTIKARKIG